MVRHGHRRRDHPVTIAQGLAFDVVQRKRGFVRRMSLGGQIQALSTVQPDRQGRLRERALEQPFLRCCEAQAAIIRKLDIVKGQPLLLQLEKLAQNTHRAPMPLGCMLICIFRRIPVRIPHFSNVIKALEAHIRKRRPHRR